MQTLKSQNFNHLSESVLKTLSLNHITTILDFLEEDVAKLSTLTKLNLPEILAIRNDIFVKYSAPLINGTALLKAASGVRRQISTGIENLDTIINGGIPVGSITEICGLAESGKTQLSFQLAVNCVKNTERTVLYVDTKGDFSAVRIQNMLQAQRHTHKEMAMILYKIRIVHIWSMDEIVELFRSIKNKKLVIENLALVIVDSLPCLMFQYLGDENKIGLSLLNALVNYSRFIGNEFQVGIIFINIQTRWIDSDANEIEDCGESTSTPKDSIYLEKKNRCLGRYWEQVPSLVLLLQKLEDNNEWNSSIQIKVSVRSSNNVNCDNNQCIIQLSQHGINCSNG